MSLILWGAALLLGGAAVVYYWDDIMNVYKNIFLRGYAKNAGITYG